MRVPLFSFVCVLIYRSIFCALTIAKNGIDVLFVYMLASTSKLSLDANKV